MTALYVCLAVLGFVLLVGLGVGIYANKITFGKRCDDTGLLRYFTKEDFVGLRATPVSFPSGKETLHGLVYSYENPTACMIFAHGMYGGHLSYTKEMEWFARHGYAVLAYDNTGTFSSTGKNLVGFSRAVCDLDHAIAYAERELGWGKIDLCGHSWGGYAVSNVIRFHPEIHALAAYSGVSSLWTIFKKQLPKPLFFALPFCVLVEWCKTGKYALCNRVKTWKNTPVRCLVAHGEKDGVVNYTANVPPVSAYAKVLSYPNKRHSVQYTEEADAYCQAVFENAKGKSDLKTYYATVDFDKMCELDEGVFRQTLDFFRS